MKIPPSNPLFRLKLDAAAAVAAALLLSIYIYMMLE